MQSAHRPATTRSEGRGVGDRFRDRLRISSLVLDEYGSRHHGTAAAGTREPGEYREHMQKEDDQIAHESILARSQSAQQMLTDFGIRHAQGRMRRAHTSATTRSGRRILGKL